MKEWFRQIKEILRHVGIRSIALAFVALFVIMLIASIIGNNFYVTEKRVLNLQGELNARNALPKATRPNRAIAPTPDYQSLSSEAFRALERQIKAAVRDGKRITL